jgi:integrase/recombinase XerD
MTTDQPDTSTTGPTCDHPPNQPAPAQRTPAKRKARQLARHLRGEHPDYAYLKEVFRHLRDELGIEVTTTPTKLPYVPSQDEIRRYYQTVWTARRTGDIVLIKTLLYTGVRVAELTKIRIDDVDLDACRIRITQGKGSKDRYVPFPSAFKETLALHIGAGKDKGATFLFESSWKKPYSTRGVRAMLARYATKAGLAHNMPPHRLRHFLFTWLKTQGIDDALIQPYSGHTTRTSLEIYSKVALGHAQNAYDNVIDSFPV